MNKILLISADNHVGAGPAAYLPYVEPKFRPALMDLRKEENDYLSIFIPFSTFSDEDMENIDGRNAIRNGGSYGALKTKLRLQELDAEGVAAEIVHSGHQNAMTPWFSPINRPYSAEMRTAGVRAYHRWLADDMSEGEGRVFGVAEPGPCLDMEATIRETEWVSENGFVSITVPGGVRQEPIPPLHDRYYDKFWSICAERGLVLSIHAGWGAPQGSFYAFQDKLLNNPDIMKRVKKEGKAKVISEIFRTSEASPLALNIGPRRVFWQMMLGGVFDRHPSLKLCLTEIRADWIPDTLAELDREFEQGSFNIKMKPSDYFHKHVWVTPSSPRKHEIDQRHEIGLDHFMFGVDYPHSESTWPNTVDWIRDSFAGVPEIEARKILGENAIQCYNLPRNKLINVAARIGLDAASTLQHPSQVDRSILDHFTFRAGYHHPAETLDACELKNAISADLQAINK